MPGELGRDEDEACEDSCHVEDRRRRWESTHGARSDPAIRPNPAALISKIPIYVRCAFTRMLPAESCSAQVMAHRRWHDTADAVSVADELNLAADTQPGRGDGQRVGRRDYSAGETTWPFL